MDTNIDYWSKILLLLSLITTSTYIISSYIKKQYNPTIINIAMLFQIIIIIMYITVTRKMRS